MLARKITSEGKVIMRSEKTAPPARTDQPSIDIGHVAWLKVVDVNHLGAFVDWGRSKDLFIPFAEQHQPLTSGRHTVVKVYLDNQNRPAGSTRIDHWLDETSEHCQPGEQVKLLIAEQTTLGFKAIIHHHCWGLLYNNELHQEIRVGQVVDGFIQRIREDGKIDLTLNQPGYSAPKIDRVISAILSALDDNSGFLALTDKSPPQVIYAQFGISKKVFKQALGGLYKQRRITIEPTGIRLTPNRSDPL